MSDVKPRECPFCGGDAFLERWMPDNDGRIYCQSCVASLPVTCQQSDAAALTAWNRRAGGDVAELRRALEAADQFITNGIELGFIRMPSPDTPDPAHKTPEIIRAALSSVPAPASGWQPIETAPRDGARALFFAPATPTSPRRQRVDWWWSQYKAWANMRPSQPYTHWQPLPAPPEDGE